MLWPLFDVWRRTHYQEQAIMIAGPSSYVGQASASQPDLTVPQRRELERAAADKLGVVTLQDSRRGLRSAGWERMMKRVCALGLAKPYVWGGYEITEAGRKALAASAQRG
jgi:hypothetical protein